MNKKNNSKRNLKTSIFSFSILTVLIIGSIAAISSYDIKSSIINGYATVEGFTAVLSGSEEVPSIETNATGIAEFTAPHFDNVRYSVNVSNIDKITAAHIHNAKAGENGPVVVTLFKTETPSSDPVNGTLATGNITNTDLEGPLAVKTVLDLTKFMELGETYVNVHTEEHSDGEIRGQIKGGG